MKKQPKLLKLLLFVIGLFLASTTAVLAGGGEYHPMNFSFGQVISGKSFNIEMQVNNLSQGGYIVGEDFELVAHHDLPGSGCETTQRTSDSNGVIKGNCHSDGTGRFVFDVQPVTKRNIQSGSTWEVYFSNDSAPAAQPAVNGFPAQGSQNSEGTQAVIVATPSKVKLNTPFTIEVKAKRDGKIQDDTSLIQGVRWTVLKGSFVTKGSPEGNNCDSSGACKNRILNALIDDKNTTIMADVTLSSGENVKTGAMSFMIDTPATPKPSVNPSPKVVTLSETAKVQAQKQAGASASPSASVSPAPELLPSPTLSTHRDELPSRTSIFARVKEWFVSWWPIKG